VGSTIAKAETVNNEIVYLNSNDNRTRVVIDEVGDEPSTKKGRKPTRPKLISIEGIPGSRKSEIIDALCERYDKEGADVVVLREPIFESCYIRTNELSLMEQYFKHPAQYGLPFQVFYFLAVEKQIRNAMMENITKRVVICERSLLAAQHVYMPMLRDKLMKVQQEVYQTFFQEGGVRHDA